MVINVIKIAPSVLSADFSCLGDELEKVACADMLHIDVMDGCFVPNISFGPPVIKCMKKSSDMFFDVHMMVEEPVRYVEAMKNAGADGITVHTEACSDIAGTIEKIKSLGCRAALCIKPATPASAVFDYLDMIYMVLVMTVEPGFGGQKFMPDMLPKVREIKNECQRRGINMDIQVDGGISRVTAASAAQAGANVFVAGSAVFNSPDPAAEIEAIRSAADYTAIR